MIDPKLIQTYLRGGTGNMDVQIRPESKDGSQPPFALNHIRAHFETTPSNNLTISVDSEDGTQFDCKLRIEVATDDLNVRVPEDEYKDWTFRENDYMRIQWTNPSSISWGLEIGLIPVSAISGCACQDRA